MTLSSCLHKKVGGMSFQKVHMLITHKGGMNFQQLSGQEMW